MSDQEERPKRHRSRRVFDWPSLLGNHAYLAPAIAKIIEMKVPATRRHLRWGVYAKKLVILPYGRFKYYCTAEAWEKFRAINSA